MKIYAILILMIMIPSVFAIKGVELSDSSVRGVSIIETITDAVNSFLGLTDTPDSYAGAASQCVKVNAGESALEFGDCGTGTASNGTYNATYHLWAYNQTIPANIYTDQQIVANTSSLVDTLQSVTTRGSATNNKTTFNNDLSIQNNGTFNVGRDTSIDTTQYYIFYNTTNGHLDFGTTKDGGWVLRDYIYLLNAKLAVTNDFVIGGNLNATKNVTGGIYTDNQDKTQYMDLSSASVSLKTKGGITINGTLFVANSSSGGVGIGVSNAVTKFQVSNNDRLNSSLYTTDRILLSYDAEAVGITAIAASSGSVFHRPVFKGVRARGNLTVPLPVIKDDEIFSILSASADGFSNSAGAALDFWADKNASKGYAPTRLSFVTGDNRTDRKERLQIKATGQMNFLYNATFSDIVNSTKLGGLIINPDTVEWTNTCLTIGSDGTVKQMACIPSPIVYSLELTSTCKDTYEREYSNQTREWEITKINHDAECEYKNKKVLQGDLFSASFNKDLERKDKLRINGFNGNLTIFESLEETTYIKDIKLEVNGKDYEPAISGDINLTNGYYVISKGKLINIAFSIIPKPSDEVYLKATGYYKINCDKAEPILRSFCSIQTQAINKIKDQALTISKLNQTLTAMETRIKALELRAGI